MVVEPDARDDRPEHRVGEGLNDGDRGQLPLREQCFVARRALRAGGSLVARGRVESFFFVSKPPRRVVAVPAPRMAAPEAIDCEHEALQRTVLPEGPDRVGRARGVEAARAAQVGRQQEPVRPYHPDEKEARYPD